MDGLGMGHRNEYHFSAPKRISFIRVLLRIIFFLFLLVFSVSVISMALNTNPTLKTVDVSVTGLSNACDGFTVLHISDLNGARFGDKQSRIGSLVAGKSYKAVVLTGDMLGENGDPSAVIELAGSLKTGVPIFYIPGDKDGPGVDPMLETVYTPAVLAMRDAGITLLDAPMFLSYGGKKIWFIPEYQYTLNLDNLRSNCDMQEQTAAQLGNTPQAATLLRSAAYYRDLAGRIDDARKSVSIDDAQIVLTHVPLSWDDVRSAVRNRDKENVFSLPYAALVLAGHKTGGGSRIPFVGAVYTPEDGFFPADENIIGSWNEMGVNQYISPGLTSGSQYILPIRVMNPPAITILKLVRSVF